MSYDELADFIDHKMRMSHVYQPVMLMTLLEQGGRCSEERIARALLSHDVAQVEYYEQITQNMVGRVLRDHGWVTRDRKDRSWSLSGFAELSRDQVALLQQKCQAKLAEFVERRGDQPWSHRKRGHRYISGTVQYEVLKRAKFRCELCGISADEKALQVDHIAPRTRGGSDDISNLQALCYSCNAMKRDRDDTDFREVTESYKLRDPACPFCQLPETRIEAENPLAVSIKDGYPVTEGHTLVIPRRHERSYFELGRPELNACRELLGQMRDRLQSGDPSIRGFNVGINEGEVAGQTIFHCHIHLIPRRKGDVPNPRGGVRHVISGKGYY